MTMTNDFYDILVNSKDVSSKPKNDVNLIYLNAKITTKDGYVAIINEDTTETTYFSFEKTTYILNKYLLEEELKNQNTTIQDAWNQYQILIKLASDSK